jgi:DNA repair protein RadC
MNYIISLNCKVSANTAEEARAKALMNVQVKEAEPMVLLPLNVYERLREYCGHRKESFIVLLLNTQQEIIAQEVVSVGTLNASLVHPREVFRSAISAGCASIIVSHNHPSGSLEPSAEDLQITKRLQDAGKLLGIELVDHVIISQQGYMSFRERNLL